MKKLLSILSFCLVFISCSPDRVLLNELTDKGTEESPIMYFESRVGSPWLAIIVLGFIAYRVYKKRSMSSKDSLAEKETPKERRLKWIYKLSIGIAIFGIWLFAMVLFYLNDGDSINLVGAYPFAIVVVISYFYYVLKG